MSAGRRAPRRRACCWPPARSPPRGCAAGRPIPPGRCSTMRAAGSPPPSSRSGHAAWPGAWPRPGSRPGDRLLTSAESSAELVVAHVAALRLGLVVVPGERRVPGARDRPHRAGRAPVGRAGRQPRARRVDHAGGRPRRACSSSGRRSSSPTAMPRHSTRCAPDDGAMLCYTSGTTGTPKGALLTHANVLSSPAALQLAWRWDPDDRLVLALPLFHMHGLGVGLHGTLLCGASAVLQPKFDPDAVLDAARAEHATLFFGVPTMYDRLAALVARAGAERVAALRVGLGAVARRPAPAHRGRGRRRPCSNGTGSPRR